MPRDDSGRVASISSSLSATKRPRSSSMPRRIASASIGSSVRGSTICCAPGTRSLRCRGRECTARFLPAGVELARHLDSSEAQHCLPHRARHVLEKSNRRAVIRRAVHVTGGRTPPNLYNCITNSAVSDTTRSTRDPRHSLVILLSSLNGSIADGGNSVALAYEFALLATIALVGWCALDVLLD